MTDVRLTATNPEDSSLVPVACNTRGELLIEDLTIDEINGDVTITGNLNAGTSDAPGNSYINGVEFSNDKGTVMYIPPDAEGWNWLIKKDGNARFKAKESFGSGMVCFNHAFKAILVLTGDGETVYEVGYEGATTASSFILQLETDNPDNFRSIGDGEEKQSEYIGPKLDVHEALVALKNEVQLIEERLKMVPSSGWEVWDGSDET